MNNATVSSSQIDSKVELAKFPAKRIADVVVSLFVLVALALPTAVIALIIKIQSQGPVLAKQVVAGKNVYSFRTAENGFGSFLATTGLNIIPRFFNVLCGDMSLVELVPSYTSTHTSLRTDVQVLARTFTAAFAA
ncbi:MAG: sugar transferase [Ancrocorticia sp.]